MLQTLLRESVEYLESEFYQTKFKFSYSSLSTLLYSPAVFYQVYVLGNRDSGSTKALTEGKLIHSLLLEPEKFEDNYVISPATIPKDRTKTLVDTVFNKASLSLDIDPNMSFKDFKSDILDTLKELDFWQKLLTDEAKIDKVDTEEVRSYWNFLKSLKEKTLVDQDTYSYCKKAVELIRANKKASSLLGLVIKPHIEVYNELMIEVDVPNLSFGLKGIIDNIKIDHNAKTISINDFKTTSKSLKDFRESIDFYHYWLQAVIYLIMVSSKWINLLDNGYQIDFYFIVIDKYLQVYSFLVSEKTKIEWLDRFNQAIEEASHHYNNRRFDLPYEFDKELVVL